MSGDRVHVDGRIVPADEATVSVRDRGFRYGDAAVETVRVYGGTVFEWEAHVERLARACRALGFDEAMPPADDLRERVLETVAANDLADALARVSITRGVQSGDLTPDPRVAPTIVVTVDEMPRGGTEGEAVWDGPATVETVERRAVPAAALPSGIRTHNGLNAVLARRETAADEALLRDIEGHVVGGAGSTLFFVNGGVLKTAATDLDVVQRVIRDVVLDLAREETFPVETGSYAVSDVREADEVFLANTAWEVRPVRAVDGIDCDVGPMTKLLARLVDERVEQVCYE